MNSYIGAIFRGILIGSIAVFIASTANAKGMFTAEQHPEAWCLAQNIYYEARGSNLADQLAVADVVLNRVKDNRYPNTICEVVKQGKKHPNGQMKRHLCQFSWYCDGKSDWPVDDEAWFSAQYFAYSMLEYGRFRGITEGATHYHATHVSPNWASTKTFIGTIGSHRYYRWD